MSEDKTLNAAVGVLTQYMAQRRMRRTPERLSILEKVFETQGHFSIDTLHGNLEQSGYHVSRATVYNTIELLIECGLVRRHAFSNQAPQYEKITGLTKHYHLVCSRCGKVREIKDAEIDVILNTRRLGKFHPFYVDMNIYGLCPACMRKSKTPKKKSTTDDKNINQS